MQGCLNVGCPSHIQNEDELGAASVAVIDLLVGNAIPDIKQGRKQSIDCSLVPAFRKEGWNKLLVSTETVELKHQLRWTGSFAQDVFFNQTPFCSFNIEFKYV